jgi:excisionase family DNA binding protein
VSHVTIAEAATRLGISRQGVHKLVKSGTLPSVEERERGRVVRVLVLASAVEERAKGTPVPRGWVTIPEAARQREVDETTVREWVRREYLATIEASGVRYVKLAEVKKLRPPRPGPRGSRPEAS